MSFLNNRYSFIQATSLLAIFLVPFISLPVLPSIYRPVSLYFLLVPAIAFILNRNMLMIKQDFLLLMFCLFVAVYGGAVAALLGGMDYWLYMKEMIALAIGLVIYFGFRFILYNYGLQWFLLISNASYKFLLLVGIIEVLAVLGVIPYSIKEFMNMAFSGKEHDRIQFTTMEASWGARVFLFSFVIYLYSSYQDKYRFIHISLGIFLLLFTFSISVFGFLALAVIIYFIYRYKIKGLIYIFLLSFVFYLILPLMLDLFSNLGIGGYYLSRISALIDGDFYQLSDMLLYDQSIFIRIGYPILSLYVYSDNLAGIGIGQYNQYFNEYLVDFYGASVLQFPEVFGDVYENEGDARSLLLKILVETSLIGFSIFLFTLYTAFKRRHVDELDNFKVFFIILTISSSITIGSWAYLYFWIGLAILPATKEGMIPK